MFLQDEIAILLQGPDFMLDNWPQHERAEDPVTKALTLMAEIWSADAAFPFRTTPVQLNQEGSGLKTHLVVCEQATFLRRKAYPQLK